MSGIKLYDGDKKKVRTKKVQAMKKQLANEEHCHIKPEVKAVKVKKKRENITQDRKKPIGKLTENIQRNAQRTHIGKYKMTRKNTDSHTQK